MFPSRLLVGVAVLALTLGLASPAGAAPRDPTTWVRVAVDSPRDAGRLASMGLDVTRAANGVVEILLYGEDDARRLRDAGYEAETIVAEANRHINPARAHEEARARAGQKSRLPTGRVTYRRLAETNNEMARMARRYPLHVKRFKLPHKSLLGHEIWGLEISENVRFSSARPAFLMTGMHHSREWPTVDLTMEFAWDILINRYKDRGIRNLLRRGRLIVVPIVNPDGFEMSRELVQEQKRKNCRVAAGQIPTREQCAAPANFAKGVDVNRNYAAFWGGPGASEDPDGFNHHGEGPASEPSIKNMQELLTSEQITVAISNHTPDGLVLRAPSAPNEPTPADDAEYQAVGEQIADHLGWETGPWTEIYYHASGTTEESAYYTSGTFTYTFENTPGHSGADTFHPPYPYVVDQYLGTGFYEGSSVRQAYLEAFRAAVDPAHHSVINARVRPFRTLTITKEFSMETSRGETFPVRLRSTTNTLPGNKVNWHVTPSLRPSQKDESHLPETWMLTCSLPGGIVRRRVEVTVARGETTEVDMRRC